MRRNAAALPTLALFLGFATYACGPSASSSTELARGLELYEAHCEVCHGSEGDGEGAAAHLLFPKPRDFTRAYFKIRSTASGSLPTDEDLIATVTQGMPGSAMPSFEWLPEDDRRALVAAVKSFSADFETLEPEPLPPPAAPPAPDAGTLALGAEKYRELGCDKCHGAQGLGDGPSAAELRDDRSDPIRPNDFTRGIYKGGGEERDIYVRFASGMDGTPMPSYTGTATPTEIWALVRYVKSLAGPKVAVQPSTGRLVARRVSEPIPEDANDPRWRELESFRVPLMLLWQRQRVVEAVEVRTVHDGESLALQLTWEDPSAAWSVLRGEDFSDAVAVQFSLSTPPPHFSMGGTDGQVNLWQWRADHQLDLAGRRGPASVYPASVSDAGMGGLDFVTAADAGNLLARPEVTSAVQDLNAEGFGTVTFQPAQAQNVGGSGVWDSGRWSVVVRRTLRSRDRGDASLSPGVVIPIAFAVWDGDARDRDGAKAVSTWYELSISP